MSKVKEVALGTLAGLTIGALAGILLAPEKGSKTRKQIKNKGDDYVVILKSQLDELRDSLAGKLESTKRDAKNFVKKEKEKLDDAKKDVKNAASDFKHSVS